jgi:hypothetical protein
VKAPVAGVIITQVDIDRITSYGGDYYYQGYYDYYDYSEKGGNRKSATGKLRLTQDELMSLQNDDSEFDFENGYQKANRVNNHSSPVTNGKSTKSSVVGDLSTNSNIDEFDLTTQIDFPDKRASRSRFNDDLDVL